MMRPFFLYLFFLPAALSVQAQIVNTEKVIQPRDAPVNGPVKTLRISQYFNLGDAHKVVKSGELPLYDCRFDQAGRLLEKTLFENDGHPYQKTTFEYGPDGVLQKSVEKDLDRGGEAVTIYSPNGDFQVDYLDSAGQVREIQVVQSFPQTGVKAEYFRSPDGNISWGVKKKMDERGNQIQQMEFFSQEELESEEGFQTVHQFQYNDAGLITEQVFLSDGEFEGKEIFIYDEFGRIAETTFFFQKPDHLTHRKTYQYNDRGDVTEWTWDNKESYALFFLKMNFDYVYDRHGNWILRHSQKDGYQGMTVERKFTYW